MTKINTKLLENTNWIKLYDSSGTAYTHELILNDDVLKYKELAVIVKVGTSIRSVICSIIDNSIYSTGANMTYHWLDLAITSYNSTTKKIIISSAYWTNANNNTGVAIEGIYARK